MLRGGQRHASPDFFWKKLCNLVHSRAHFSLHCFAIFEVNFLNVAFADKSEKRNLNVI